MRNINEVKGLHHSPRLSMFRRKLANALLGISALAVSCALPYWLFYAATTDDVLSLIVGDSDATGNNDRLLVRKWMAKKIVVCVWSHTETDSQLARDTLLQIISDSRLEQSLPTPSFASIKTGCSKSFGVIDVFFADSSSSYRRYLEASGFADLGGSTDHDYCRYSIDVEGAEIVHGYIVLRKRPSVGLNELCLVRTYLRAFGLRGRPTTLRSNLQSVLGWPPEFVRVGALGPRRLDVIALDAIYRQPGIAPGFVDRKDIEAIIKKRF